MKSRRYSDPFSRFYPLPYGLIGVYGSCARGKEIEAVGLGTSMDMEQEDNLHTSRRTESDGIFDSEGGLLDGC
jgi:hypothetical protein